MKKYTSPELDVISVTNADIITTSPGTEGPIVEVEESMWNW